MLLYLGLVIILGSLTDLIIEGFHPLQIIISALGVTLAIWSLIIPLLKNKIANSKLSFASGFIARTILILIITGLCFILTYFWASPNIYAARQINEARAYAAQENYSDAYDLLKNLSQKYSEKAYEAKREIAYIFLAQKRNEEAATLLNEIISAEPYDLEARYGRILHLIEKKDRQNAKKEAHEILLYDPHFGKAYVALGDILREEGDLLRTIHYYNLAVRENPDLADVHFKLGTTYRQSHSYSDALYEYKKALSLAGTEAEKGEISQYLRELTKEIDRT
jgi:tetratricopeptide (TPR) repeat protein